MNAAFHPRKRPAAEAAAAMAARVASAVPEPATERLRPRAPSATDVPVHGACARADRGAGIGGAAPVFRRRPEVLR